MPTAPSLNESASSTAPDCSVRLARSQGRLAVDSAGLAIHALQPLIEKFPQQGRFLTNKLPAVNLNGRTGLVAFGQFAEAKAKLLGIGQPGGMVEPNKLPPASTLLPGSRLSSECIRPPRRYRASSTVTWAPARCNW